MAVFFAIFAHQSSIFTLKKNPSQTPSIHPSAQYQWNADRGCSHLRVLPERPYDYASTLTRPAKSFVRFYGSGIEDVLSLGKPALYLFVYIASVIEASMKVDLPSRDGYSSLALKVEDVEGNLVPLYDAQTIRKALHELIEKGFIARAQTRDQYWVNPRYVFKGTRHPFMNERMYLPEDFSLEGEDPSRMRVNPFVYDFFFDKKGEPRKGRRSIEAHRTLGRFSMIFIVFAPTEQERDALAEGGKWMGRAAEIQRSRRLQRQELLALPYQSLRMLLFVCAVMEYGKGTVCLSPEVIKEKYLVHQIEKAGKGRWRTNVQRKYSSTKVARMAIDDLLERGILRKSATEYVYWVNPRYCSRGEKYPRDEKMDARKRYSPAEGLEQEDSSMAEMSLADEVRKMPGR